MMKYKRLAAFLLGMVMIVALIPAFVFAQEIDCVSNDKEAAETSESGSGNGSIIAELPPLTCSDPEASDNDELFKRYIEKKLDTRPAKRGTKSINNAGSKLKGSSKIIYDKLVPQIKQVAEGNRTSTIFEVTLEDLGVANKTWTAKELGVSAVVVDNSITSEACAAMWDMIDFSYTDQSLINQALLADCSYELYWYNKTTGGGFTTIAKDLNISDQIQISGGYNGSEYVVFFTYSMKIGLYVAQGYANSDFEINTSQIDRVNGAINNAKSIVDSAKPKSDYEKLVFYRTEICDRVTYDKASADDNTTPYGDPWQLISVFDDYSTTNVVCEGYSKAFKYLCDLTDFNGDISCITVTGTMAASGRSGGHMWNVVNMENGKNYLVDVTNCDSGMIGDPDYLFLIGYSSGNENDGYIFSCNKTSIIYKYHTTTLDTFSKEDLVINNKDYSPDSNSHSGTFGNGFAWELDSAGELNITGNGAMTNWTSDPTAVPWYEYRNSIKSVVIENGITSIGHKAFYGYTGITTVTIPKTVTIIGDNAFYGCSGITIVNYGGTLDDWQQNITFGSNNSSIINVTPNCLAHKISVSQVGEGTASVDKPNAEAHEMIKITAEPAEGYVLETITINGLFRRK